MAKYSNVVEYNIVTDVDTSGIVKLQNELTKLKQSLKFDSSSFAKLGFDDAKIEKSIHKVNQLQAAITAAFNPKIGTIDLGKLNASLQKEHTSLQMIVKDWEQMGTRGTMAISNLSNALLSMNKGAMNVNTTLSKIANTFGNTVRWGITASIFQGMMGSIQGAVSYMKDLDESLTQIQMVTNSSKEDMRELAQYANVAAQALGSTTTDYTNAVKVFVQEGYSERESKQYANLSTKLANVSEQNTQTTSDQITAYRNAFQLDYKQTVEAMDKVANVANNTASNVSELMTASQRSASVAQAVGASQDSFLASIATIESVTRQSAEEIGNGLKTIYQRFADIRVGKTLEDGADYGEYAQALKKVGVDVLDMEGNFKGFDQILTELQGVWGDLSETMKIAVGEKVAGKFQYNRFVALMNNPEYYQKAYDATQGASGMMDQMNDVYIESIEGRLNTLQAAGEQVMSTLFDQDAIEPVIGQVTELLNGFNDLVDAAGGLGGVLQALGAIMLRTFSTQIAGTISNIATAISTVVANNRNANQLQTTAQLVGLSNYAQTQNSGSLTGKLVSDVANNYNSLSDKTQERIRDLSQQILELEEQKTNVLKEQEHFFKQISERAVEEKNIKEQQIEIEREILAQKRDNEKITQEQYEDEILKLDVLEDENLVYEKIRKEASELAKVIAQGGHADDNMIAKLQEMRREASGLGINIAELESLIEQFGIAEGNLDIGKKMVEDTVQAANFEARINGVVKTLSSVTSIAFGFSMISDAIKTLTDDSATLEEKLDAVVMNGLMGLTMLLPGLTALVTQTKAWVLATVAQTNAIAGETAAEKAQNAAQILNNLSRGTAIKVILASIAERIEHTAAIIAETVALKAQTIATLAAAHPIAALAIGLGALAIAAAAATKAFIDNFGAVAQTSKEYEKQRELLAETKRNYQDLQEGIDSLKSSMDNIANSKKTLGGLTEGTKEWKEAVRELNDEVLTLLQTYPELAKYVTNDNGVLNIEEEGLDDFYQNKLNEASHLQDITSIQQMNTLDAKNNQLIAQFASEWGLSADKVAEALDKNAESIGSSSEELNAAYFELQQQVMNNVAAMDSLKDSLGALDTGFKNYSGREANVDMDAARQSVSQKYGGVMFGSDSFMTSNKEFLDAVAEATGQNIVAAERISDTEVKFKTAEGDETAPYSAEALIDLLAESEITIDNANAKLEENRKIYEIFGATFDEASQRFKNSSGEVIESLSDLSGVTEEQAAIMEKMADQTYHDYMTTLYGSAEEFAKTIASGQYSTTSEFADREAGLTAFMESQRLEGLYGDQYQSMIENLKSELGSTPSGEDVLSKYNSFETIEDFTRAVQDGTINLNGLSEAVKKLTPETVDLTKNINGNEFTNRIDVSSDEDKLKGILDDANVGEGAFNRMARDSYEDETGYYQQEKEHLESLIAAKEEDGIVTSEEKKEIADLNSEIQDLDESAKDTTAMMINTADGVVDLRNKIGDISEVLSDEGAKGTIEWYQALTDLDEGLSQVLNIDAGTLSDKFIESGDALAYAQRMAEGDLSAIDDLRDAASRDIVQNLEIQATGEESVDELRASLMTELNQLQADIDAGTITVGTDLDTYPFTQKLNEMLAKSQITEEQASQILSSMGMEANIYHAKGEGYVQQITYHPRFTGDAVEIGEGGPRLPGIEMVAETRPIKTEIDIPYLKGTHYTGSGVNIPSLSASKPGYTGGYSGNPKSKGGGGKSPKKGSGSNKNNQKKDKEKSQWDYLTDITNDLDRAADVMEKMARLEDRLYGKNRISQIKKLQSEYKSYIKLLQQEVQIAEKHAKRLRTNAHDENGNLTINGYAYRAGIRNLQFDAQGNLDNGRQIEQALLKRVNNAVSAYNKHRNDEDNGRYEYNLNQAKSDYDGFLKAMKEYEETILKVEDTKDEIQEYKEKIQDATDAIVDAIQEGVEDMVKAMDNQREFDKLARDWAQGGSGYSHLDNDRRYYSEGLANLFTPTANGVSIFDIQQQSLSDRIADAKSVLDGNPSNADDEKLSEQAAFENLQEATENVLSTLQDAIKYYDSLLDTVEEASSKMDDLIDGRLEEFNKLEDYLDTRLDQLKLLFGDKSYENQTLLYNQKIEANMERMVSINAAIEAKQATVEALERLEASGKELSTEEREVLQNARDKVTELQEQQLETESKLLQDISEKLRAQTSAEMDKAVREMFNGADVDWLSQQWEIATRNSEKYFDDYNRAFETQKLQLKFQEALNDSQNNSLATQQKIASLANEYLTYLREKNNLSEYDVKHAQMELDILQKQIALEDARDNKSQMRLQRNAAGNYDFVYAADEDAIAKANEALLAAQQESYNLSKQKYLEVYESAFETATKTRDMVVEIATDASLSVEERAERIKFIIDNLGTYLDGSSVELGEISINLYNSFVESEQLVAEENLGALTEVFNLMREESLATSEAIFEDTNTIRDNIATNTEEIGASIEDGFATAGENISGIIDDTVMNIGDGFSNLGSSTQDTVSDIQGQVDDALSNVQSGFEDTQQSIFGVTENIGQGILQTMTGTEENIGNGLKRISHDISEKFVNEGSVKESLLQVISTIDDRFNLSKENILVKVGEIDESLRVAYENISGSGGYLDQFSDATNAALQIAGDSYQTFAQDSIDYSTQQLERLRETTQDWKQDLNTLRGEIDRCAKDIGTWKNAIDKAINSSVKLFNASNAVQQSLSGEGAYAAGAGAMLDVLASSADNVGSSIASMANSIENSYQSINSARQAAADAYRDMGAAASEAAGQYQNMGYSAADARDLANEATAAAKLAMQALAQLPGRAVTAWTGRAQITVPQLNLDEMKAPWSWGGFASGGYTGSWTDRGVDDKNGKWAVLHQKELVLNQADTRNMLSAVELVRDIMSGVNSLPTVGKNTITNAGYNNTVDQRVEINATFPGVTEAIEIKQALEQLADNAYQEAHKYKY